jgi:hypothetical protein
VIVIEPTPRGYAAIIVMHNPLETLHIGMDEVSHLLGIIIRKFQFALTHNK